MASERVFQNFQDAFPDASDNNIFEAQPTTKNLSDFFYVVISVSGLIDKKWENIAQIHSKLYDILEERGTLPDKARRACLRLFSKLAANAPWSEISDAFLFIADLRPSSLALDTHRKEDSNESALSGVIEFLQKDWKVPYYPDSLDALKDYIQHYEQLIEAENAYYGKIVSFIQSSGMGKSRLVDAFGEKCPMINLVLRKEGSTGYPPSDGEIVSLVTRQAVETQQLVIDNSPSSKGRGGNFSKRRRAVVWNHSLAMGLVQACLENFSAWVDLQISNGVDSLEGLAAIRHHQMALPTSEGEVEEGSDLRSEPRIDFCRSVAGRARAICDELVLNSEWRALFNSDQDSSVRQTLSDSHSAPLVTFHLLAEQLNTKLHSLAGEDPGPYLTFAFDEAATFLEQGTPDPSPGRFVAINRIISLLKRYKIWFFFISTESKIQHMFPPDIADRTDNYAHDPSERRIRGGNKLLRLPPFVALPLDIGVRRKMRDAKARETELRKPFSEIMNINHLAMYGRPLWMAYTQIPQELYSLAAGKLLGGIRGGYLSYDKFHVFAALSFRLSLDVCVQNPRAISLNRTAVDSHMRVVISVDPFSGAMDTISPSEPVLAEAAMKHLCIDKNWETSVYTLCKELLEGGCIEKGVKGELFARWVVILASDAIRSKCLKKSPHITTSFTVQDFLMSLYGEKYHESIALIDPQILEGKMNFSHFVPARENLYPEAILPLCHELLRRGAAMQLASGQPTYDQLIPYYCGANDEPFDESKCGAILIQVKYKVIATSPQAIFGEPFTPLGASSAAQPQGSRKSLRDGPYFVFEGFKHPLLFLLFDLGAKVNKRKKPKAVQFSLSDNQSPPIWAIHSKGHGAQVFGCISTMRCADKSDLMFLHTTPAGSNLHDQLALSNHVFANLDPQAYFPNAEVLRKRLRSSDDDAGRE